MPPPVGDPPNPWKELQLLATSWMILLGLVLILIAIVIDLSVSGIASVPYIVKLAKGLLGEVGIALIVAWFLLWTVEKASRKHAVEEHTQRTKQLTEQHKKDLHEIEWNVFRHLLRFSTDNKVVDEHLLSLQNSWLVRRNLELRYEFGCLPRDLPCASCDDYISVMVTIRYELHLMAGDSELVDIHHYFENVILPDAQYDKFLDFQVSDCDLPPDYRPPERWKAYRYYSGIRQGVRIDKVRLHAGKPAVVRYTYRTIRRVNDCEMYVTTLPADGLTVTVAVVDQKVAHLTFIPDSAHRSEFVWDEQPDSGIRTRVGVIRNAFLPHQGFMLFWCPKELVERMNGRPTADKVGPVGSEMPGDLNRI